MQDPSLKQTDFDKGIIRARRYRNRRIGDFLKELGLTEGRGTGIPTIQNVLMENHSPKAKFDTDEPYRRYFIVEIPINLEFINSSDPVSDLVSDPVSDLVSDPVEDNNSKENNSKVSILIKHLEHTPKSITELMSEIGLTHRHFFRHNYLLPAIKLGLIEYTIPDKPQSSKQKYRLTSDGKEYKNHIGRR